MENQSEFELRLNLNDEALDYLRVSAKWSLFLSIVGFIAIGLMILAGIFIGSIMSMIPSMDATPLGSSIWGMVGGVYIAIAVIYFFPVYYFYKYATNVRNAIQQNDEESLTNGLKNLKSHHKFLGIFTLVILIIYATLFLLTILFGALSR